jgi:saccharopine dehydrogenase-like NADP-dependent oxidoreductase
MPETFRGKVGECFEKTLRHRGHLAMIRALYDLGLFSKEKIKLRGAEVAPRELTARLFEDRFAGSAPDVTIMRIEAHEKRPGGLRALLAEKRPARVLSFTLVDHYDPSTGMTSMMRTTAWPASIIVQMLAGGEIAKRGGLRQELDVPADAFLSAMARRGIQIHYEER